MGRIQEGVVTHSSLTDEEFYCFHPPTCLFGFEQGKKSRWGGKPPPPPCHFIPGILRMGCRNATTTRRPADFSIQQQSSTRHHTDFTHRFVSSVLPVIQCIQEELQIKPAISDLKSFQKIKQITCERGFFLPCWCLYTCASATSEII